MCLCHAQMPASSTEGESGSLLGRAGARAGPDSEIRVPLWRRAALLLATVGCASLILTAALVVTWRGRLSLGMFGGLWTQEVGQGSAPRSLSPNPRRITIKNSCPFNVKVVDGKDKHWRLEDVQSGAEYAYTASHCQDTCRTYFAPSSWSGKPGKYSMGAVEPLGFFEYSLTPDGALSPDISFIGGIGIPMTMQCAGEPLYGCTDGGYGGWQSFQERLKKYCPGKATQFPGSLVTYCSPGQYGGVEQMPYGKKWDIQGTFKKAKVTMSSTEARKIAFCQPWSEATQCAQVNRGVSGCTGETMCDGEHLFYQHYDMRHRLSGGAWLFNGYAAFVHTICGVYSGFAFPADDHGVGSRAGHHMKYASNKGAGCRSPVIELCPAASKAYVDDGGYAYPPAAGWSRPSQHASDPSCHTATSDEESECYVHVKWAKEHGIFGHPTWYPGLSASSTFEEFQSLLHSSGHGSCPRPCHAY